MNKLMFFKVSTAILFLLNVGMIAFFFSCGPDRGRERPKSKRMLPHEYFEMTEEQSDKFINMLDLHHAEMDLLHKEQATAIRPYLYESASGTGTVSLDQVMVDVDSLQRQKLILLSQHFREVKASLTEEQKERFDPFLQEVLDHMDRPKKKKKKK